MTFDLGHRPFADFDDEVRIADISALHDLVTAPVTEPGLHIWARDSPSRTVLLSEVAFVSIRWFHHGLEPLFRNTQLRESHAGLSRRRVDSDRVRDTGNGQLERQGDWNGRDRVLGLVVKGGGWQEDVEDAKYATIADAILPDAQTGFRCIETAR